MSAIKTANSNISSNSLQIGEKIVVPFGSVVPTNISYTSEILELNLNALKRIYPFLELGTIGNSSLNKKIQYIKFGNGQREVFYSGAIHANEWITSPLLMKFIEILSKSYVNELSVFGYQAKYLFDNCSLYIVPMVNPDGVDLVTGKIKQNTMPYNNANQISNSFPNIPFPSGWKANIKGIDLNLQFPADWEKAKEIKYAQGFNKPAPRDFVGYSALSEPESIAMYNFTNEHNFNLAIAYHTQGKVIYYKYQDYTPEISQSIANTFSKVSRIFFRRYSI